MQNTSADYKLEINKPSRTFECKVTIGDNIYTNEDIVDVILDYPQPSDGFTIGNTISQTLDLTLINRGDIIYSTSQVKLEIGLKIEDRIEYIPMGIFNIDDIEKTDYTTKFICYDNMIKFETPYFSELSDKPTLQQVVNELAKITGIQFEGSLPAYTVSKLGGFSCREVLSYVASICGGNALITRSGKFTIKGLSEVVKAINGDNYFDFKREEVKYKVGKISCQVDENSVLSKGSLGTDSMELSFENPWITEKILTELYNKLNGLSYLGYSMKWQGDLSLDPYDIITVTDIKNVTRNIPILSQKLTYTGGLTSEIEAKGESKNKNSFSSSGSTTNKINRLVTEQAVIKEALIEKANIKDLEAVSIKTQTLEAKTAKIEEAIIDVAYIKDLNVINANIENLKAADATINNALIGKADITQLNAVQGNINTLNSQVANIETLVNGNLTSDNIHSLVLTSSKVTVENGFIKNAMIENLDVSKINAGTISTDKFLIKSADGGIEIRGATQQFKDKNNKVRLQLGKDSQGNFNFILRGEDGTSVLLDHTGLKAKAITDGLIVNNMLGQGAVTGDKVNIGSLIQEVNKDTNTSTIKATKIQLDKEGQSLDIAFNTLKTNVDNIEVGGTNLAIDTNKGKLGWNWSLASGGRTISEVIENNIKCCKLVRDSVDSTSWSYISYSHDRINREKYLPNKQYTISFEVKASVVTKFKVGIKEGGSLNPICNDRTTDNTVVNTWIKLSVTVTTLATLPTSKTQVLYLAGMNSSTGVSYIFRNLKIEEGNKATAWTAAPEDLESRIESNTTQIAAQQGKIEALISDTSIVENGATKKLKDAYANLKLTVNGLNSTVGSHTTNITNLQGQMSTANSNISKLDGKVQTVESKQVSFEQNLNGISQRVQSTESNVTTLTGKVNTANSNITTATELAQAMALGKMLNTDPIFKKGINGVKVYNNSSGSQVTVTRIAKTSDLPTTSTHCMEIKVIGGTTSPGRGGFYFGTPSRANAVFITRFIAKIPIGYSLSWYSNTIGTGSTQKWLTATAGTGKWTEYVCKVTCGSSGTFSTTNHFALNGGSTPSTSAPLIWYLAYATVFDVTDMDYTVQDNTTQITTTNNKVVSLETNLNGISSKVSNVESSVATINGNVTSLQNRMSTAESKITSSAIITTVSSTINTAKQEAINSANSSTDSKLKNYATTSSVTQTVDSWVAKFTSTGGSNLLKNSDAKNGQYMWTGNGVTLTIGTSGANPFFGGNEFKSTFPNGLKYSESIKLKANTDYVYEGWIYCNASFKGSSVTPLHFWCMNKPNAAGQAQLEVLDYRQDVTAKVFNKCYIHFRTKSGDVYFTPFVYGGPDGQMVAVRQLSLTEGKVETAWTQHPSEIYEGSTVIDGSGVTVNNGALRVKNKAGQTVLQGDSFGNLSMRGSIETINDYGRLYLNGNSLKGFLNSSSTTPIYASGVWRPYNDSYQTGYVSVGNTNALIGDDNGCLYMSGDNNPNGTRAILKYSRNSGNVFGAVEFTQYGGTSLVSSLNGGRDKYGIWNSAEGYVLPFRGNEYLGKNNRYWEAIYVRTTVSYNLNSVIDESKLLGEVQSETQRNKINTPTKKDFIECIKELDFGVYDSSDNINVRVLKTTNELTCQPIINTSLKLGVNNARNLLVKECTDREGENPIQTIDLISYCSALAITLQDTIGKIESLENENLALKERLAVIESFYS